MRPLRAFLALALALALTPPPAAADLVMRGNGNELRLYASPCVHAGILGQIRDEWRAKFKKARATISGKMHYACWIEHDGAAFVMFEDEQGMWDMGQFKDEPGA